MAIDAVQLARSLAPLIDSESVAAAQETTLTAPVVDAIKASGLYHLMLPVEMNGWGAEMWTAVEVIEELSRPDPSTGWAFMANVMGSAMIAPRLGESAAKEIFGQPEPGILAGMVAPTGKARPVDGGYIINGTFSFASGSGYANWVTGGAVVETDSGREILAYVVPRDSTECLGNWNVQGLMATGSYDYAVHDLFVPQEFTFNNNEASREEGFRDPQTRVGQRALYLDRFAQATSGHLGVALGTAKRALEEITLIADNGKQRRNAPPIREQQLFQHGYVTADAKLRAARAYAKEAILAATEGLSDRAENTELETHQVLQSCCYAVQCAVEVVEFAYYWSGAQGLRVPHPLGRIARDMILGENQHIFVDTTMLISSYPGVSSSNRPAVNAGIGA
ncbi:acyl-CoA dehydrogenase family protein [uncultured Jatrophihabitans sp.]|uniref:acyl-CoA dehydrogenase family protein n=1 Tax=uncultured Jatrophihabitans sp. TaxID=1610747 RepID=UPI0035CAAC31